MWKKKKEESCVWNFSDHHYTARLFIATHCPDSFKFNHAIGIAGVGRTAAAAEEGELMRVH